MTRLSAFILALPLLAVMAYAVHARPAEPPRADALCGERARIVERLRTAYGETRMGYGLQRGTSVVEIYASEKTGSWTILTTSPSGVACLVAAGQNWAPETLKVGDPV